MSDKKKTPKKKNIATNEPVIPSPRSDGDTQQQLGKLEVRTQDGHLLFCFNPFTDRIEVKNRGKLYTADINQIRSMSKRNILTSEPGINIRVTAQIAGEEQSHAWIGNSVINEYAPDATPKEDTEIVDEDEQDKAEGEDVTKGKESED